MLPPYLDEFSKFTKIDKKNLLRAFEIEKEFNIKINNEPSPAKRKELYKWVYSQVHVLYGKDKLNDLDKSIAEKKKIAFLFKKEFINKSIIDIGCGDGALLFAINKSYSHKKLLGVDISNITPKDLNKDISFINSDIVNFELNKKYDVAVLDNVYEHISKSDSDDLLTSTINSISKGGKIIFIVPNRNFGPWDVTRIFDFTYSGKTKSMGTHLNETTYSELINKLKDRGFNNFMSPIPLRKVKYLSFFLRFPSKWMVFIENSKFLMNLIKKFKFNGKPIFRFEVILIASTSESKTI
jgi:2-polyprenyl-3-methyl-5-hydroxy-6-metoxy-1,4-benzoquinol methylase